MFAFLFLPALSVAKPAALLHYYVHEAIADKTGENLLMGKILRGQAIRIAVEVPSSPDEIPTYKQYVQKLYDMWFNSTAEIIRASGRRDFDDLLPRLSKPVNIAFVSKEEEHDVLFAFLPLEQIREICDSRAVGCAGKEGKVYAVYEMVFLQTPPKGKVNHTHLHEVGHSLGLGDQYEEGRNRNTDVNYAGDMYEESIMNNGDSYGFVGSITADDADGMILAADLALHNFNRGGKKGWRSLVPESERYYIHGKMGNSPYSFFDSAGENDYKYISFVKYNKKGKPSPVQKLPFAQMGKDVFYQPEGIKVLQTDNIERPVVELGRYGETIYTSYYYDSIRKLVVNRDKQVLFFSEKQKIPFETLGKKKFIIVEKAFAGKGSDFIELRKTISPQQNEIKYYSLERTEQGDIHYVIRCAQWGQKCHAVEQAGAYYSEEAFNSIKERVGEVFVDDIVEKMSKSLWESM